KDHYKVIHIQNAGRLTLPAQNALLKTLEEPPKHVVFILATTESHKVPETITSRTQKFNFTLASTEEVQSHLNDIAKKENIKISDEALTTIARHSGGSLRDALSALDHVRHMSNDISDALVREAIGAPDIELTKSILNAVETNNVPGLLNIISNNSYISIVALAKDLLNLLIENLQSNKLNLSLEKTNSLMQKLILVENSSQPEMQLLIALLGSINESNSGEIYKSKTINKSVNQPKTNIGIRAHSKDTTTPVQSVAQSNSITDLSNEDLWPTTLEDIRATHNTLYSILRMAEYNRVDDTVYLGCQFDFHKKRLNESKNKEIIMRALAKNTTSKLKLIIGTKESKKSVAQESNPVSSEIDAIRMVFNGAEPLE
ncbi:MAG: hypothetical protein MUF85_03140, partial [Patescibacteria group bacterium]|nr:hypothetical protein [Patescibacteria group bacterium]